MKHLLTGVAMAAALAIAAPAWAQNAPMTPSSGGSKPAPTAPAKATPTASKPMAKGPMHHTARKSTMSSGDAMTEELNRQELARLQGGSAPPPPPPPPMTPGGNNPTSGAAAPTAGIGAPPPPSK